MNPETININARYYLEPSVCPSDNNFDVIDRALEYHNRLGVVFSNGTENECREWVLRNCEEPVEHTSGPWHVSKYGRYVRYTQSDFTTPNICDVSAGPDIESKANAALIATSPALLALLEQYHQSFPSKESGKLICEARGWTI